MTVFDHAHCTLKHLLRTTLAATMPIGSHACSAVSACNPKRCCQSLKLIWRGALSFTLRHQNMLCLHMQIGVKQVIAGWDEGILGDGKDLPPMKVLVQTCVLLVTSVMVQLHSVLDRNLELGNY